MVLLDVKQSRHLTKDMEAASIGIDEQDVRKFMYEALWMIISHRSPIMDDVSRYGSATALPFFYPKL